MLLGCPSGPSGALQFGDPTSSVFLKKSAALNKLKSKKPLISLGFSVIVIVKKTKQNKTCLCISAIKAFIRASRNGCFWAFFCSLFI